MKYEASVLTGTEKRIFALRTLFSSRGYKPYRMRKFEEYDLYSRNKDFLTNDMVITFTDTNGSLKALKPDVTLSIVKNLRDDPGSIQRLYYDENVYRVSGSTNTYKEIMQMGLECIGAADNPAVTEVLDLAAASLELVADNHDYVLKVSDLDVLTLLVDEICDSKSMRSSLLNLAGAKNLHGIRALCAENEISGPSYEALLGILELYGHPDEVLPDLIGLCKGTCAEAEAGELASVLEDLSDERKAKIAIDFSIIGDTSYYNGLSIEGYIDGIPECVLIGGRYDMLMRRMKKRSRAIGFAVYLDNLARLGSAGDDAIDQFYGTDSCEADGCMINIALPKGRLGEKVYKMFEDAGYGCPDMFEGRKLLFENRDAGVRYFWVKPSDVPIYVERGAADIGVAGKDILLEYDPNVFELKDLGIGKCRMVVAGPADFRDDSEYPVRVATKFPGIAQDYYASVGRDIEIIKLNGSIEIAPILGLSDVIVDLVETGTTLKENDLVVLEDILDVSARLIANKSGYNFKSSAITELLNRI